MTNKRQRELARAKYERQVLRRAEKAQRNRIVKFSAWGIAVLIAATFLVIKPGSDSGVPVAAPNSSSTALEDVPVVDSCNPPTAIRANNMTFQKADATKPGKSMSLKTNCGDLEIDFNPDTPLTAGTLSFLASSKFYDGTKCHRLTTQGIFVLQCGDPAADGSGGPGFKFDDENLPTPDESGSYNYARGTVAMANSGPNTNGSQFFLVYEDSPLPPNYTVVGNVTKGLSILDDVAAAGVQDGSSDGAPLQSVVIEKATIN